MLVHDVSTKRTSFEQKNEHSSCRQKEDCFKIKSTTWCGKNLIFWPTRQTSGPSLEKNGKKLLKRWERWQALRNRWTNFRTLLLGSIAVHYFARSNEVNASFLSFKLGLARPFFDFLLLLLILFFDMFGFICSIHGDDVSAWIISSLNIF